MIKRDLALITITLLLQSACWSQSVFATQNVPAGQKISVHVDQGLLPTPSCILALAMATDGTELTLSRWGGGSVTLDAVRPSADAAMLMANQIKVDDTWFLGGTAVSIGPVQDFRVNVDRDFADAVLRGKQLSLFHYAAVTLQIPLAVREPERQAFMQCIRNLPKAGYGTIFALQPMARPFVALLPDQAPRLRGGSISGDDYPPRAMREEREGTATIEVTIATSGRLSACTITHSSGHADLDEATCRLYTRRARYIPGSDHAGQPQESKASHRVTWKIPR